jgi:hypothetical protein
VKVKNKKKREIFNNVNYDYPQCGGYKIEIGSKYLTIIHYSNYFTDNRTGNKCRIPLSDSKSTNIIKLIHDHGNDNDMPYILQSLYKDDAYSFSGGIIVQ